MGITFMILDEKRPGERPGLSFTGYDDGLGMSYA
jgi:hypothetical protein